MDQGDGRGAAASRGGGAVDASKAPGGYGSRLITLIRARLYYHVNQARRGEGWFPYPDNLFALGQGTVGSPSRPHGLPPRATSTDARWCEQRVSADAVAVNSDSRAPRMPLNDPPRDDCRQCHNRLLRIDSGRRRKQRPQLCRDPERRDAHHWECIRSFADWSRCGRFRSRVLRRARPGSDRKGQRGRALCPAPKFNAGSASAA